MAILRSYSYRVLLEPYSGLRRLLSLFLIKLLESWLLRKTLVSKVSLRLSSLMTLDYQLVFLKLLIILIDLLLLKSRLDCRLLIRNTGLVWET